MSLDSAVEIVQELKVVISRVFDVLDVTLVNFQRSSVLRDGGSKIQELTFQTNLI